MQPPHVDADRHFQSKTALIRFQNPQQSMLRIFLFLSFMLSLSFHDQLLAQLAEM